VARPDRRRSVGAPWRCGTPGRAPRSAEGVPVVTVRDAASDLRGFLVGEPEVDARPHASVDDVVAHGREAGPRACHAAGRGAGEVRLVAVVEVLQGVGDRAAEGRRPTLRAQPLSRELARRAPVALARGQRTRYAARQSTRDSTRLNRTGCFRVFARVASSARTSGLSRSGKARRKAQRSLR
jgi:hypothetical protein